MTSMKKSAFVIKFFKTEHKKPKNYKPPHPTDMNHKIDTSSCNKPRIPHNFKMWQNKDTTAHRNETS